MSYPTRIELQPGSDEYETLVNHFEHIGNLVEDRPPQTLVLTKQTLFGGDSKQWELFYDIFLPTQSKHRVFVIKKDKAGVDPKRTTSEEVRELFRFLLFQDKITMQEFALQQALKSRDAPTSTLPASSTKQKGKRSNLPPEREHWDPTVDEFPTGRGRRRKTMRRRKRSVKRTR